MSEWLPSKYEDVPMKNSNSTNDQYTEEEYLELEAILRENAEFSFNDNRRELGLYLIISTAFFTVALLAVLAWLIVLSLPL